MDFSNIDMQKILDILLKGLIEYGPKLIGAIAVFYIGFKAVNYVGNFVDKILKSQKIDQTLEAFLISLMKNILKIVVVFTAVGVLGIQTTSLVAVIAAAGVGIGMSLSGTLSHFASGIIILLFKPYKVGDYITTDGHSGTVKALQIFSTNLLTPQGKTIIIPNAIAIGGSVVNGSDFEKKRIDLTVGIAYDNDIDLAKKKLEEIAKKQDFILHDEGYVIGVKELADSSVNLAFNFFVKTGDHIMAPLILNEAIKKEFDKTQGLDFPFPQRDVHLFEQK